MSLETIWCDLKTCGLNYDCGYGNGHCLNPSDAKSKCPYERIRQKQEKIIYCMKCKFYDMRGYCDREQDCEAGVLMNPDDFCSRAERK